MMDSSDSIQSDNGLTKIAGNFGRYALASSSNRSVEKATSPQKILWTGDLYQSVYKEIVNSDPENGDDIARLLVYINSNGMLTPIIAAAVKDNFKTLKKNELESFIALLNATEFFSEKTFSAWLANPSRGNLFTLLHLAKNRELLTKESLYEFSKHAANIQIINFWVQILSQKNHITPLGVNLLVDLFHTFDSYPVDPSQINILIKGFFLLEQYKVLKRETAKALIKQLNNCDLHALQNCLNALKATRLLNAENVITCINVPQKNALSKFLNYCADNKIAFPQNLILLLTKKLEQVKTIIKCLNILKTEFLVEPFLKTLLLHSDQIKNNFTFDNLSPVLSILKKKQLFSIDFLVKIIVVDEKVKNSLVNLILLFDKNNVLSQDTLGLLTEPLNENKLKTFEILHQHGVLLKNLKLLIDEKNSILPVSEGVDILLANNLDQSVYLDLLVKYASSTNMLATVLVSLNELGLLNQEKIDWLSVLTKKTVRFINTIGLVKKHNLLSKENATLIFSDKEQCILFFAFRILDKNRLIKKEYVLAILQNSQDALTLAKNIVWMKGNFYLNAINLNRLTQLYLTREHISEINTPNFESYIQNESNNQDEIVSSMILNPPLIENGYTNTREVLHGHQDQLNLSNSEIQEKHAQLISENLVDEMQERKNNKFRLQSLNLSNTRLTFASFAPFLDFLSKYPLIRELDLANNKLGGEYISSFFRLFNKTKSSIEKLMDILKAEPVMISLNLNNTGLDEKDSQAVAEFIESSTTLENLNLQNNQKLNQNRIVELNQLAEQARQRSQILYHETLEGAEDLRVQPTKNLNTWKGFYRFTYDLIIAFKPTIFRLNALKSKTSLNFLESLQLRAQTSLEALTKLNQEVEENPDLLSEKDYESLTFIWTNFIVGHEVGNDKNPFLPEAFKQWLDICYSKATSGPSNFNSRILSGNFYQNLKNESVDVFATHFRWYIEPLWYAAVIAKSQLFNVDVPITTQEQKIKHAKSFFIHSLLAVPGILEITHLLRTGEHLSHLLPNLGLMTEAAHIIEFSHRAPLVNTLIHKLSGLSVSLYNKVSERAWISTEQRLNNFYTSFNGASDFSQKIEIFLNNLIHIFSTKLKTLDKKSASLLGQECAKHLANALMLGYILDDEHYPLSIEEFSKISLMWLTYIPTESKVNLTSNGVNIPIDTFLRGAGLIAEQNGEIVHFRPEAAEITLFEKYTNHHGKKPKAYTPDIFRSGYRFASQEEVKLINSEFKEEKETKLELNIGVPGNSIAKIITRLNFKKPNENKPVTTIPCDWLPTQSRVELLEKRVEALDEANRLKQKELNKLQIRVNLLEEQLLKAVGDEDKRPYSAVSFNFR